MTGAITRAKALRGDLSHWDGKTITATRIDATGGTITGLVTDNEVDVLQVFGSGTDRTRATIAAALNHINTSNVTLVFAPGTWTVDSNTTIGANFTCHIPAGCVFNVSSGITLTFSGDVFTEDSDNWYTGSGTVVVSREGAHGGVWHRTAAERTNSITPRSIAYPEGHLLRYCVGDGTTDDSAGFHDAMKIGIAFIPNGYSFKIVTPATRTGRVVIIGEGPGSKLLCDSTVVTVTNGDDSVCDNFWMENITAPYIITRDPSNWGAAPSSTTSNTVLGYQPTVNDADVWSGLTAGQQNQQIGPVLKFTGTASNITVERIFGRFVLINIMDATDSVVRNCSFRAGKGTWGGIVFDNYTNIATGQVGTNNRALGNKVRYCSFSGITFLNNTDGQAIGNHCHRNGESGVKTAQGTNARCFRMQIEDNHCHENYYDGVDGASTFPLDDTQSTYSQFNNNRCYRNGGNGMNADGKYNSYTGNHFYLNYKYGFWGLCSDSLIGGNHCIDNNQDRDAGWHEILGGNERNLITGNKIWMGAGANSSAIYAANTHVATDNYAVGGNYYFGTTPTSYLHGNIDDSTGKLTEQTFVLTISNDAGTLKHNIYQEAGTNALGNFQSRITGATAAATATPTGADASTAMAAGGKIGSGSTNIFWMNTAAQTVANAQVFATIVFNDTATAGVVVRAKIASIDINGVTRNRLAFEFFTAAGAAHALTTGNIGAGDSIQVQFMGKLQ